MNEVALLVVVVALACTTWTSLSIQAIVFVLSLYVSCVYASSPVPLPRMALVEFCECFLEGARVFVLGSLTVEYTNSKGVSSRIQRVTLGAIPGGGGGERRLQCLSCGCLWMFSASAFLFSPPDANPQWRGRFQIKILCTLAGPMENWRP